MATSHTSIEDSVWCTKSEDECVPSHGREGIAVHVIRIGASPVAVLQNVPPGRGQDVGA